MNGSTSINSRDDSGRFMIESQELESLNFLNFAKIFRFFFKKFLITCISLDRRGGQMLNKYSFGVYTISYSLLVKLNIYSTLFSPINSNIFIYKIMAKNLIYNVLGEILLQLTSFCCYSVFHSSAFFKRHGCSVHK